MRCPCDSKSFVTLGVQEAHDTGSRKTSGRNIYLINCTNCSTTLSCSKAFYTRLKNLESQESVAIVHERINLSIP